MKGRESGRSRVLVVATSYPGPHAPHQVVFIHRRALQLAASGLDVRVLTRRHITIGTYLRSLSRVVEFYTEPRDYSYDWDGLHVEGFRIHLGLPLNYSPGAAWLTYRAIRPRIERIRKSFDFQLMQLATWGDLSLAASWVARELGVPYIASAEGGYVNRYYRDRSSLPYRIQREVYDGSKLVVCVSEDLARKVLEMTDGAARVMTFYSGVDLHRFSPDPAARQEGRLRLGLAADEEVVLHVGRLGRSKGTLDLLQAFSRVLAERRHDARLVLVGPLVEGRAIRGAIQRLGVERKVVLTGPVRPEEVPLFLNAADVFAFPSWSEGLPNALLEACACGLPVVATPVGGIPEVIRDGVTGLLVRPMDSADLHQKLSELLRSPDLRGRLGNAARDLMVERFDARRNGAELAGRIKEIITHG